MSIRSSSRPEALGRWFHEAQSLRGLPALPHTGLRQCRIDAIENLEDSFQHGQPRALIRMATGSGRTCTAITSVYRLGDLDNLPEPEVPAAGIVEKLEAGLASFRAVLDGLERSGRA